MSDVCNVVAQLKLTSKGKLQYGKQLDEIDLLNGISKLCISSNTIRKSPKLGKEKSTNVISEKQSNCYQNYFTPERKQRVDPGSCLNRKETLLKKSLDQYTIAYQNGCQNNSLANFVKPIHNTETQLRDIEQQYHIELKELWNNRIQEYHTNILKFDAEHASSVEAIEKSILIKQNEETKQLDKEQNQMGSGELASYQASKQRRENVALEKVRQAELHRKDIEMKIKKENALKKEKLEKRKMLADFAEHSLEVLNEVTKLFVDKQKHNTCDEFKLLVDEVNKEYAELCSIMNQGININCSDIDNKIKYASEKMSNLNILLKKSEDLSKQLEERVKTEQKVKEDAEKKAKEMEKIAEADIEKAKQQSIEGVTTKLPAIPGTSSIPVIPALENNLNIANAAPFLVPVESMLKPMLQMCIPKMIFREYLRLQKIRSDTEKLHEPFSKSTVKEKKAYKFDLHKVINTTINAISDESPKHLMDKIIKLITLLSEREVTFSAKRVSTKLDPHALTLSKDLIAKKLVLQGSTQVASSHKAAFAIAAVAIGVWTLYPDFGELLLAYFYLKCPYTVPFYIPKSKEISTVDYCKLIGYSVHDEDVESEDIYLNKLSGVIRLYAAIISSDVPPALGNKNHPYGLEHGWVWLTRVLNLEPRTVTATIIFDFLEVAGHAMLKRFGKQMQKLLLILCEDFMPKILEVTPTESKASVTRLKIFLDTCIKEDRIKEPSGYLSKHWYTGGHRQ